MTDIQPSWWIYPPEFVYFAWGTRARIHNKDVDFPYDAYRFYVNNDERLHPKTRNAIIKWETIILRWINEEYKPLTVARILRHDPYYCEYDTEIATEHWKLKKVPMLVTCQIQRTPAYLNMLIYITGKEDDIYD